jgi:hypothetical protein
MKEMKRVSLAFKNWCISQGWSSDPVALKYESVASFVCAHVLRNKGSTRSVYNLLASLKKNCVYSGVGWLNSLDQLKLRAVLDQLKLDDLSTSKSKRPLRVKELVAIICQLNLQEPVELLVATMLAFGHDGLLRSSELLSGLLVRHLVWRYDKKSVRVEIERSKMNRSGESEFVTLFDYGEYSAVALLRKWFNRSGLWNQVNKLLFPAVKYNKLCEDTTPSYHWWRKIIKLCCKKVGLDDKYYSGHSLRAGGATDLFVARVPYYIIKKMGRWKSDAAMLYYRCDEDVENAVAEAFTKLFTMELSSIEG